MNIRNITLAFSFVEGINECSYPSRVHTQRLRGICPAPRRCDRWEVLRYFECKWESTNADKCPRPDRYPHLHFRSYVLIQVSACPFIAIYTRYARWRSMPSRMRVHKEPRRHVEAEWSQCAIVIIITYCNVSCARIRCKPRKSLVYNRNISSCRKGAACWKS